jgi:hypothetical protein
MINLRLSEIGWISVSLLSGIPQYVLTSCGAHPILSKLLVPNGNQHSRSF